MLHNAFTAAKQTHPTTKMYAVSLLDDFFEGMKNQHKPILIQVVNGYKVFNQSELDLNISNGTWKLRKGLHAMAYGTNLANKVRLLDFLSVEKPSSFKIGGFDMGSFMNETMKLVKEFQPSLMHASVSRHLQEIDPKSPHKVHLKVLRLMIAVGETEGNDVIKIMKKYTHTEITKLYDRAIEGGFNFNLLDEFDRRYVMLEDLGLIPLMYDTITTEIFLSMDKSKLKDAPRSGLDLSRNCAAPLTAYYSKRRNDMASQHTAEFRREAVRVALTSGLK